MFVNNLWKLRNISKKNEIFAIYIVKTEKNILKKYNTAFNKKTNDMPEQIKFE